MRKNITICVLLFWAATLFAAAPTGYYNAAEGKSGEALRKALQSAIDNHKVVSYDNLYTIYKATDSHSDGSLWDMYSACNWQHGQKKCGSYSSVCDCYNREHSIPQSWFGGGSIKSDAFHVYPTDGKVNNQRGNHPFGECSGGTSLGSKALGRLGSSTFSGYSGTVFEPADEYKGDFARTYFYMATRYAGQCEGWAHNVFSSENSGLSDYAVALFLKWHRQDPVSEKERVRNDAVYSNSTGQVQGNRNPFIDYPCLAEYIWGNRQDKVLHFDEIMSSYDPNFNESDLTGCSDIPDQPELQTPYHGQTITIEGANVNSQSSTPVSFKASNFTSSVSLMLAGSDASLFSLSKTMLSASEINNGIDVQVMYHPTALGNHTATLNVSGSDLNSTVVVNLEGACQPSLVSPIANEIYLSEDNVGETESAEVLFKATNISKPLTVVLQGENAPSFSLSPKRTAEYTLSVDEALAGKIFNLTYIPTAIGTAKAQIVVSSDEIGSRTINLFGTTAFNALPATDITKSGFVANWTNAGNVEYTLNLFTMQQSDDVSTTVFDAPIAGKADAEAGGLMTVEGKAFDENEGLRLGSGSGSGTITTTGIDFSRGGKVEITAKAYRDDQSTLTVKAGAQAVGSYTLTSSNEKYTFTVEPTTQQLELAKGSDGQRIYISHITIATGSAGGEERVPVDGYPITLTNTTHHKIVGLEDSTDYFYTVTLPDGTAAEPWHVRTGVGNITDVPVVSEQQLVYYQTGNTLYVENLTPGCTVRIFTPSGILFDQRSDCRSAEQFALPRGIYILTTTDRQTIKVAM